MGWCLTAQGGWGWLEGQGWGVTPKGREGREKWAHLVYGMGRYKGDAVEKRKKTPCRLKL